VQAEQAGFKAAVQMCDGGEPIADGWTAPFRSTLGVYRP
jgi:hypothetical protein